MRQVTVCFGIYLLSVLQRGISERCIRVGKPRLAKSYIRIPVGPGSGGNLPLIVGAQLLPVHAAYGDNRPVPVIPGRNVNGEKQLLPFPYFLGASLTDHRIFLKTNSDY